MKWDRPSLITLVYCLFTLLYTLYIAHHNPGSSPNWFYLIEFLLFDAYIYFILQGLARRSKNWDVVLLLPLGIWAATMVLGFMVVGLFRIGGFNKKDKYNIDMLILSLVFLAFSLYAQRWIQPRKSSRSAR